MNRINNFTFFVPTRIIFGQGAIHSLVEELKNREAKRPLIITDQGVINAGLIEPIVQNLKENGYETNLFYNIDVNPRDNNCEAGATFAREINADIIIAIGGGSPIDAAKAIGMLVTNQGNIHDYLGYNKVKRPSLPLIAVPTTAGTGSEVTIWSVITNTKKAEFHVKDSIGSDLICPQVAIVDPFLTTSLPPSLTATTGMDALTHAIEAYTALPSSPITDIYALQAINYICKYLGMAYANGDNIEAREHLMLGSLLAGVAFSNSDTTVVHSLSEGIGGLYDVPHGLANAIFLPFVMEYNISSTPERFIDIAKAMGCNISKLDVLDAAFQSVEAVKKLSGMLNIPGFKSLLIEKETFSMIARVAMLNSGTLSNPRKMSENDFVNILNNAYNAG